ncbi:hypothetical protein AWP75_27690 [Escherichia coli]|nr:hypothetical protein AWP62_17355 [Escherichia coli]OKV99228.1 hypothetical protein AWP69_24875 [Escherichia coli]OKW11902.1 hypothetical protein AWP75_27690 [Escherichia coli]
MFGSGAHIAPHPNPLPKGARGPLVHGVEYCAGFLPLPPGGGGGGGISAQSVATQFCKTDDTSNWVYG